MSVINFLEADKCKPCEIYRKLYKPDLKRQYIEWKHTDSQKKKKSRVQWPVIKGHADSLLDIKGPIIIDFLEKGTTVNSANNTQFFRQDSTYLLNDLHIIMGTKM